MAKFVDGKKQKQKKAEPQAAAAVFSRATRSEESMVVTLLGIAIPDLFGGALILETVFNWPGMGLLAYNAAIGKDYPMIMGIVLFVGTLVILGNLIADVCYGLLDPRIRLE